MLRKAKVNERKQSNFTRENYNVSFSLSHVVVPNALAK